MITFYTSILLTILASVLYHVIIKLTPANANPALALTTTYATCIAVCLALIPLAFPLKSDLGSELKQLNWASFALAIALVGLEVGFILAYRAGWKISLAAIVVNVAATLLLVAIGLLFFREKVSLINALGIFVCLIGLVLVNWKN